MDATEFQDWLGRIGLLSRQKLRQTFQALALYECASADVVEVSEVSAANAQILVSAEKLAAKSVGIEASALQPSSRDGTQTLSEAVRQRIEITGCPHCDSHDITLWGHSHGLPRYRCKSCKRTFNALTKTPLAGLRMKDKWLEHSRAMIDGLSLSKTAERCGVHHTTAFRWRHRFLDCLSNDKPTTLSGIVESDEMFILESYKGKRRDMPRAPRKRGGKAAKPGLSDEQIPVIVARDRSGATTDAVLPKLNRVSITAALGGVVTSANQFCCDGGTAIMAFARRAAIPTHVLPSPGKPMPEAPDFHINNINAYHSRFKGWMRRFHGVATKNLPNYLGWRRTQEALGANITPTDWILAAIGLGPYQQQTRYSPIRKVDEGDFLKYTFSTSTATGGTWTVYDKQGTKYTFGTNAQARQDNSGDTSQVTRWMLEEVRDTNNNFIRYEYYKDANQIYPSKIYYAGTAAPPVGSGRAISATTSGFPGRISLDAELMFSLCSLMSSRWKHDKPMSRTSFDRRFPDEAACARHLAELRWPDGFVCPACGVCKAWELATKPFTWECSGCHRQTSVTAGTVMHRSKLSLRTWFEAIHLLTCHSNGISAEQAQAQLGLGSYKTAWLLLHKLRRAMVNPKRTFIVSDACLVAISKTSRQALTWADIASSAGRGRRGRGAVALQA